MRPFDRAPDGIDLVPRRHENDLAQLAALGEALVGLGGSVHGEGRLQEHAHPPGLREAGRRDARRRRPRRPCRPSVRARSVEPLMRSRRCMTVSRSISARAPPPTPMTEMRPGERHGRRARREDWTPPRARGPRRRDRGRAPRRDRRHGPPGVATASRSCGVTNRRHATGSGGRSQLHPGAPHPARRAGDEHALADGEPALGEQAS